MVLRWSNIGVLKEEINIRVLKEEDEQWCAWDEDKTASIVLLSLLKNDKKIAYIKVQGYFGQGWKGQVISKKSQSSGL